MVAPVVDENEWKRGRSELKDEIPLSELPRLEMLDILLILMLQKH